MPPSVSRCWAPPVPRMRDPNNQRRGMRDRSWPCDDRLQLMYHNGSEYAREPWGCHIAARLNRTYKQFSCEVAFCADQKSVRTSLHVARGLSTIITTHASAGGQHDSLPALTYSSITIPAHTDSAPTSVKQVLYSATPPRQHNDNRMQKPIYPSI